MKQLFKSIWSYLSPWQHSDDKTRIRTYNILMLFLIVFITSYMSYYLTHLARAVESRQPTIIFSSPSQDIEFLNNPYSMVVTSNMIPPKIISTNGVLPSDEFFVGEVVGVKYFGIYGIVTDKIIGVNGYKYEVRWKDISHGLPKDIFYTWELFRPESHSIPASIFQN